MTGVDVVDPGLRHLLEEQAGVVSLRQAFTAGLNRHDVTRLLRRRELVALHHGVYLDHTGEPTWLQRAWGGVLAVGSPNCAAALTGESALRAAEGPGSTRPTTVVEVAVLNAATPAARAGVRFHRVRGLESRVLWHTGPPRLRYEEAALDVAARCTTDVAALGELSRAVQSRRTTARRLLTVLDERERIARRRWLASVLDDLATGACSVLEHGYLTRVERPHGLATARRQVRDRAGSGVVYRDAEYDGGLVVELDGRLFHESTSQRDRDFDRDLDAAVRGKDTVRVSYGQVFDRPCWTARRIGLLLQAHGWLGTARPCGPTCQQRAG